MGTEADALLTDQDAGDQSEAAKAGELKEIPLGGQVLRVHPEDVEKVEAYVRARDEREDKQIALADRLSALELSIQGKVPGAVTDTGKPSGLELPDAGLLNADPEA